MLNVKDSNESNKSRQSFTADLDAIETLVKASRVKVEEIERVLDGRGFASLALILSLPFVQPIPLPGLSMIFGLALMALGLRLVFGRAGGLPEWVRRREIDGLTLQKMILGARKIFAYVERFFRPRLPLLLRPPLESFVGLGIMLSGFALTLPLPPVVLFSNSLPAWAVGPSHVRRGAERAFDVAICVLRTAARCSSAACIPTFLAANGGPTSANRFIVSQALQTGHWPAHYSRISKK